MERHRPIEVWGTGEDVRDLIFIDDFVAGALAAFRIAGQHLTVNIGSGAAVRGEGDPCSRDCGRWICGSRHTVRPGSAPHHSQIGRRRRPCPAAARLFGDHLARGRLADHHPVVPRGPRLGHGRMTDEAYGRGRLGSRPSGSGPAGRQPCLLVSHGL
ncbi:MAG: hypothetical protein HC888_05040 [Candidatus Competibacteraceae bacterium]|nr:hypothetical protein [Candidatus Competibacteraceae bacterium]